MNSVFSRLFFSVASFFSIHFQAIRRSGNADVESTADFCGSDRISSRIWNGIGTRLVTSHESAETSLTWSSGRFKLTLVALFFFLALFGLESRALAWPISMTWDPNPPTDMVTGYTIHYGTVSRLDPLFTAYGGQVDAGNVTTYTIDLPAGSSTYYISATAYNQSGTRSDYSNEIVATFTSPSWSITTSAGPNGAITPSGTVSVSSGASQIFAITPTTGYHVATVTVDGTSVGAVTSYTFSNVTANHTIAATFAIDTFTVTASAGSNGSISPSGTVTVNRGASRTFTITPTTGYHVATVMVDGTSVGAVTSYTFSNVTANHTIAATFAIDTFTVTASAGANGSISPNGTVTVNRGASRTFTITPTTGYHVATVTVDGTSVGAVTAYTFSNVTANHTIAATFAIDTFTVTASASSNGSISPSGTVTVNRGTSQTFTITPATGHYVANVIVDGTSVGTVTSYTFSNVAANHTITVSFTPAAPQGFRIILAAPYIEGPCGKIRVTAIAPLLWNDLRSIPDFDVTRATRHYKKLRPTFVARLTSMQGELAG